MVEAGKGDEGGLIVHKHPLLGRPRCPEHLQTWNVHVAYVHALALVEGGLWWMGGGDCGG